MSPNLERPSGAKSKPPSMKAAFYFTRQTSGPASSLTPEEPLGSESRGIRSAFTYG